jgi:phytol kinase
MILANWSTIEPMFAAVMCLVGVGIILVIAEQLWNHKILKGEEQRKFVHIGVGIFVAFWPWLIDWKTIQVFGILMLCGVLINRFHKSLHFDGNIRSESYGDICFPIAVTLVATVTDVKLFFAIAILHLALADGLAAVVGKNLGQKFRYQVFHQSKTVFGSMTFWFLSTCILGTGLLFANDFITFQSYVSVLFILPPILTVLENVTTYGLDNITVPLATVLILQTL